MHSYSGIRATQSAGADGGHLAASPYHRPLTVSNTVDKSSILWKDFLSGVKKRKLLIRKLYDAANESSASISVIKKALLDLRQQTLSVVEDALEIEYRSRMDLTKVAKGSLRNARLPPISSFKAMEEKEDIFSLVDMMSDVDDLFHVPNIRVMLPASFPEHRNPFMLGKSVDEMATITPPHPEPGNAEEELKVLELLRYKRASRALLRAEAQVANRLPISLYDVEKLLTKMTDDFNLEKLLRCVCTLLDNEHAEYADEPNLACLLRPVFNLEAHEFLNRLNAFKGVRPIRIDAQIQVRHSLREANLEYIDDPTVQYLMDWLDIVLNPSKLMTGSADSQPDVARGPSATQSRLNKRSLETISEVEWNGNSEVFPIQQSSSFGGQPIPPIAPKSPPVKSVPYYMQDNDDLISEVGSKGYVNTHENIHVEERPKSKMQKRADGPPSPPRSPPPPRLPLEVLKRGSSREGSRSQQQQKRPTSTGGTPSAHDVGVGGETEGETDKEPSRATAEAGSSPLAHSPTHNEPAIPKRNRKKIAPKILRDDDDEQTIKQNAPGILRRKIRAEVERAMNEAGLSKASGRSLGGNGGTDGLPMGGDVLSSVRYELNKMQQELLRRQVLDPRHYAITSVDAVNHASQGLTVADINSFGLTGKKRKKITADDGTMGPVTLIERSMDIPTMIGDVRLFITVILDIDAMELRCTIQCSREDAFRHKLIDELPLGTDNKNITVEIATTRVSRLVFSKVAEHTLDELIHATTELKRKMLQNVSEILNQMIHDAGVPHGDLVFTVDRSLCSKRFSEDSVLVDLVISRNEDCNGVLIRVTPLAGLFQTNVGPVILHLSDHELEVLLIAQHSLFEKGMEKWTSMETVAQWLANKVIIKKVATTTTRPLMSTKRTITSASGKLNSSMLRSLELGRTSTIREEDNESVASQLTLSARGRDEEDDALSVNTDTMMANPKVLLLLDVKIDTKIELAQTLIDTWRATNVPKLIGLTMVMEAWQDLDVMVISVKLIIPSRKTHKRLMHDAKRHNYDDDDASGDGNGQGLMDMDNYSDDGNYDYDTGDPTVIDYEYRLTRAELLTFGSTSMIEHKKVSLSKNRQTQHDEHPENMLWNVLNRLKVSFSGSSADPYKSTASAADPANWSLSYDRQILRDVKTVSNTAVILTVTVHGGELLIEGERVESKHSSKIGSKRVAEDELQSFVYEEGYTLQLLKYQRRKELATHLLNSLKLVDDADYPHRLELYTFVESKMITIALAATLHEPEEELGSIEINSHHTLNDVRIIMKYEFEIHQIPPQFRFIYKGSECSLRQETFRRAWECLPTLYIVSKVLSLKEMGTETEDMVQRRLLAKPKKVAVEQIARVPKGMRRMPGKYAPIPLPTLCAVTEGRNQVFLLHNATTLLNPGDIIRIGNVTGRDYVVMSVGFQGEGDVLNMHMIEIDPLYDLIGEPDFHLPTQSNLAWPQKHAGTVMKDFVKRVRIIKRPGELGFIYNWQGEKNIKPVSIARESTELQSTGNNPTLMLTTGGGGPLNATGMTATNGLNASASMVFPQDSAMTLVSPSKLNASGTAGAGESSAKVGGLLENSVAMGGDDQSVNSQDGGGTTMVVGSSTNDYIPGTKRKGKKKIKIRKFTDCWIWKCIPAQDDQRLKWRQNYDDGLVHYGYEFGQSEEFFQHFRVKAWYSYLEVLCTDSRVPEFTIHHQRVHEMPSFSLDYYTKLAFDRITEWTPSYKKGIERMKFIKLIKDVTAFPDLKRPARIAQLDMYFQKVVKSEYGIVQKYINYHGFCYLLKLISLVRFPPKRKREEKENDDDDASVGKDQKNGKDDDDQSQMTDDLSVGSLESESSLKGKKGDKATSRPSRSKRDKGAAKSTTSSRVGKGSGREDKSVDDNASSVGGADPTRQIDIEHVNYAYQKFILDYIMMYPTWYDTPWRDAKLLAMRKEAVRYCAATRLAAMWRGYFHRQEYLFFLRQHIKLQANIRRKLSAHRTRDMIALLEEDWYFRQRYYYATMITKIVRRFLKRCWYHRMIDSIRRQQVLLMKARRQKFKQIKDSSKKTKMYSEAKRLSGVFVIINVYRKDPRNYTKDFGVIIQVYVPVTQQKITFVVEDEELRSYMAVALEVDVVTTGQILDRRNLKKMISQRLIVHKASKKSALPIITFSKHALGQRGEKTMTCAKRIMGERFVAKIFETVEDLAVQMYHQVSCKVFTCVMEMHELRAWIREEHILTVRATGADELVVNSDPIELHPKRKLELYDWVLKHLVIDTRRGTFKVVWSNQYEKSRKREMIVKIQSVWRRALVRPIIVAKLDKFMLRVKLSAWDESSYYINLNTGGTQWEKPKLLGPQELPTIPTRRWVPVNYPDSYVQYYVNPFTGKFTYLVPDRAARIIQSLIRNHLLKTIQMTRENYLKAGKIFMQAEKQYQLLHGQHKLSAVINFALYKHVLEIDEPGAKEIYREAVDLSESNPLVTRAYAFYIMATCENPIQLNRDRALILLLDARRKDPENVKFVTAYAIFQFAVLRQPRDFRTLINLAMVHCLLYNENYKAEKLLRRALAIAPFEERVIEVWKFLKDRFPERHLVYNPKSRVHQINQSKSLPVAKRKVVHGRPVLENIEWAGWVFVEEDIYHVSKIYKTGSYWYNPADGTETDDMPDFKDQWRVRRERSQWIGEEFGMDQYYDPLTAEYFQHHTLTDTYS